MLFKFPRTCKQISVVIELSWFDFKEVARIFTVVLEQTKGGGFTNYIPVEFLKDACDSVDELHLGDEIEVSYRLSGRRWQRDESSEPKYFLSAEAMSFRVINGGGSGQSGEGPDIDSVLAEAADDDVPF